MKNTTIEIDTKWAKIKRLPKKYFFILVILLVAAIIASVLIITDITCNVKKNGIEFESKTKLRK